MMKKVWTILRGILAIIFGFVGIILVNFLGGLLINTLWPGSLSLQDVPLTTVSQIVHLGILFIAGFSGGLIVVLVASRAIIINVLIFAGLALINDFIAIFTIMADLPLWYKVIVILTVPLQIWLGAMLGMIIKGVQNAPQ